MLFFLLLKNINVVKSYKNYSVIWVNCYLQQTNPPYLVPMVEVVPAPWTSSETVQITRDVMIEIGQEPVLFKKEHDGFGANRLQWVWYWRLYSIDRSISSFLFFTLLYTSDVIVYYILIIIRCWILLVAAERLIVERTLKLYRKPILNKIVINKPSQLMII